jgi:DNA-binding response OmpR family regulator
MGKVSGHDVVRHAKKVAPETVLIMMTGCSREENRTKAFESGVDYFFNKPFALGELLKSLPSPTQDSREVPKQPHVSM